MKKITLIMLSLALLGLAGSAMAAKNPVDLMHCGCVYTAVDETTGTATMEWQAITISNRGKGHRNHVTDSYDDCLSGFEAVIVEETTTYEPLYTTFVRDFDDCVVDGVFPLLADCDDPETEEDETPLAGDACGSELEE